MHTATTTPRSNNRWQPHRTIIRVAEGDEPDFTDLGIFSCGDVTLTPWQHQVVAMFAAGFNDDRIVGDYLCIGTKRVQEIVVELFRAYGWKDRRAMGCAYKAMKKKNETKGATMSEVVDTQKTVRGEPPVLDPTAVYPAEIIQAAKEQEASGGRRDLTKVLTDDVLAIWHQWYTEGGLSAAGIAKKAVNGLIDIHQTQVSAYLAKYRERLAVAELDQWPEPIKWPAPVSEPDPKSITQTAAVPSTSPGRKAVVVKQAVIDEPPPTPAPIEAPETAVAETAVIEPAPEPVAEAPAADPLPKPEIEPLETAVAPFAVEHSENLPTFLDREYRPQRPGPGDALAALAALVNNEQIRVRGSVKLNLEIEFGE